MADTETPAVSSTPPGGVPRGVKLLHDPVRNKGTAFTEEERDAYGLRGLLPPGVQSQEVQARRVMENLRRKHSDLERYIALVSLQDRNETLFYRVVVDHLEELMPIIYTPTVGRACQLFGHIFRRPRGLYVSAEDRGRIVSILRNWPHRDVRISVVTDGGRILGLGDLGAFGMGIPIGKLALYSACAGIHPTRTLPIMLDVGTDNQELRENPLYIGLRRRRLERAAFDELVAEFFEAMAEVFPKAIVQLEDFATENAFRLLHGYRERAATFDDDIQGTAGVALAGILSALRITGESLTETRFLFLGAGEAGIGIADLIVAALREQGVDEDEARERCWFVDSKGLVHAGRRALAEHKRRYAHELESGRSEWAEANLLGLVHELRPHALIGVSGQPDTFTRPVLEAMAEAHQRPIVMALSNPTSKAECTAEQAYAWTGGRAIYASGSPFPPVDHDGRTYVPGQGNNAYVFPGVGLGAIVSESSRVTDEMFFVAAKTLAQLVSEHDLALGRVYPSLGRIREVSHAIAVAVAEVAFDRGLAGVARPDDLAAAVRSQMYEPVYHDLE